MILDEEKFWDLSPVEYMVVSGYTNPSGKTSYTLQNRYRAVYYETSTILNIGEKIVIHSIDNTDELIDVPGPQIEEQAAH
jgi:hypothetical protein